MKNHAQHTIKPHRTRLQPSTIALAITGLFLCNAPAWAGITVNYDPANGTGAEFLHASGYQAANTLAPVKAANRNDLGANDGNTINILSTTGAGIAGDVFGAFPADVNIKATNNTVNISGSSVIASSSAKAESVTGGRSFVEASGNKVNLSDDANVKKRVYGGRVIAPASSTNLNATDNHVTMKDNSKVGVSVYGGATTTSTGDATANTVTLSGNASVGFAAGWDWTVAHAYGGFSKYGKAESNSVTMKEDSKNRFIAYGGQSENNAANLNKVFLSDNSQSGYAIGGEGVTGMNANEVHLSGSAKVTGAVAGGSARALSATSASATNNIVTLADKSYVGGNVYGGKVNSGSATGNRIVISGDGSVARFDASKTVLYGGAGTGDVKSGNVLEVHSKNIAVKDIQNFAKLDFYLPNSIAAEDTMLFLNESKGASIEKTKIGVGIVGGPSKLELDQWINLVHNNTGTLAMDDGNLTNDTSGMKDLWLEGTQGISLKYNFTLKKRDGKTLGLHVDAVKLNPSTKPLPQIKIAALASVLQGGAVLDEAGLVHAHEAALTEKHIFALLAGNALRYKTGSHVDANGINLLAGASAYRPNNSGRLMLTGFLEAGWGNYDSFNNFTSGDVRGKGNASYYGLGLLARQEFNNQLYTEASVRTGRVKSDFSSTISGQAINFEQTSPYYGAHLGLGYLKPLRTGLVDMYGKYFWARVAGKQSSIAGDTFSFSDVNSHRTRLGARYHYPIDDLTCMKIGAAWEYDFDGKAAASVHNLPLLPSSIKGHTGTVDAGIKFSPSSNKNLSFEANIQGHWGKRQGVSGNVVAKYVF